MAATLDVLLTQVLPPEVTYNVLAFSGKPDLLAKLTGRLRGYSYWDAGRPLGLCVLVDEDREDCTAIKAALEQSALAAGLHTRSAPGPDGSWQVLNRVVVEELEAWFFGDVTAVRAAYPAVPASLGRRSPYRNPDAVPGGTWEALERVLVRAGYHRGGLRKLQAAEDIAAQMLVGRNTSPSFRTFVSGVSDLLQVMAASDAA